MMKKIRPPLLYDPLIIPRVKQYLEENVHQTYVDVTVMAKELQDRYREYNRRKTVPFRQLVEQAYKTVLHSYGLDSNPSSDNDGDGNSDLELMDEDTPTTNHMSDTLTSMYMNNKKGQTQNEGELIDISSDESNDEESLPTTTGEKTNNNSKLPGLKVHGITITKVKNSPTTNSNLKTANPSLVTPNLNINNTNNNNLPHVEQQNETLNSENIRVVQQKVVQQQQQPQLQIQPKKVVASFPAISSTLAQVQPVQLCKKRKLESGSDNNAVASQMVVVQKLKKFKYPVTTKMSNLTFMDIGGMDKILKEVCELLFHVKHPEVYRHIGLPPPRGFLLHGPPGCGKTLLAQAIAGQLNVPLIQLTATELIAGVSGESEERIRELFEQAASRAPCILFIDEVDAISSNRSNASKDMERRIVTQLLSSLDGLSKEEKGDQVLVIGATNRADALDPALRRVGRFDQEISLGIPDREAREQILEIICERLKMYRPFNFAKLATLTPGYVGADLLALATRAAACAIKRSILHRGQLDDSHDFDDFDLTENTEKDFPQSQPTMSHIVDLIEDSGLMEIDESALTVDQPETQKSIPVQEEISTEKPAEETHPVSSVEEIEQTRDKNEASEETSKETSKEETSKEETSKEEMSKETSTDVQEIAEEIVPATDVQSTTTDTPVTEETAVVIDTNEKNNDVEMAIDLDVEKVPPSTVPSTEILEDKIVEDTTSAAITTEIPKAVEEPTTVVENETTTENNQKSNEQMDLDEDIIEIKADDNEKNDLPTESKVVNENKDTNKSVEDKKTIEITEIDDSIDVPILSNKNSPNRNSVSIFIKSTPELSLLDMVGWLSDKQPPIFEDDLNNLHITMEDFVEALKYVQPSAKREGFITVPDTTWDDIGSLRDIREELKLAILAPVKFPQKLKILGLNAPSGVLLCGPPGCGKTLLAKAIANEAGINFISVKGPELLNMYVGESERAVRQCFQRARNSTPCVIFFDEFDSLCPKRSDVGEGGAGMRVVNQLLTEMDGIEDRKGVFLMAATNRPDMVDPAVLRPGRLDKILYVGLPLESDRADILRALTKNGTKPLLSTDVSLSKLATLTAGYTGADLAGLVRQASLHALKDSITIDANVPIDVDEELQVTKTHFIRALNQLKPSVSIEDQKHYEKLRLKYAAPNQLKQNSSL